MHHTEQADDAEITKNSFFFSIPSDSKPLMRRRIAELDYLDLQISADYSTCDDHIEGKGRSQCHTKGQIKDGSTAFASPPVIVYEKSPWLPYYHDCSFLPPKSGLQAAADATRHTLMELIDKTPEESSYELSFNVFIKDQQSMEEFRGQMEEKQDWKSKGEIEKKNKNSRSKVLYRSERENSGNFLLKIYLPDCLSSKKKPKEGCLNLPRVQLRKESQKPEKKEWWKMLCSEITEAFTTDTESNSTGS